MSSPLPVPPSLAIALKHAGLRGVVTLERADGRPLTPQDEQLGRAIVEMHEADLSDQEVSAAARKALASKPPLAPTGTGGE